MRGWITALVIFAVLTLAPDAWGSGLTQNHPTTSLTLEELWRTDGSEAPKLGPFVSITGMIEAEPGVVWVADSRGQQVLRVDDQGSVAGRVAGRGEGPGEVEGPTLMTRTDAGHIAVYDLGGLRIEVIDPTGAFVRRVHLPARVTWPKGFAALAGGDFVLSGAVPGLGSSLHRFSPDGKLISSWDPLPQTRRVRAAWIAGGGPISGTDEGLLYSRAAPHEVMLFPMEGDSLGTDGLVIANDPELLSAPGDEVIVERTVDGRQVRQFRGAFPQSRGIYRLPDGNILNVVVWADRGESLWQLYDLQTGTLVAATRVPVPYRPWNVTADGDVLVSYPREHTGEILAARLRLRY